MSKERIRVTGQLVWANALIRKIDACLMRVQKSDPLYTTIRLVDDEWTVKEKH